MLNNEENKKRFRELLLATQRPGVENLLEWLDNRTDFYESPASSVFHGSYIGGLLEHSLNVYDQFMKLVFGTYPEYKIYGDSIAIVCLLHDLCKVNTYMLKQLYIYAEAVKQEFGKYPKYLCFNCFKNGEFIKEEFDIEKCKQALKWAEDTIERIKNVEEFYPSVEFFSCRYICPYTPQQMVKKQCTAKILPDNYMENYETDNEKRTVWRDEGISDETMDRFQVCYDSFSNRIVYPIRNTDGKIVNIGGRALDSDWKEKGQRKYCYFYKWGTIDTLYGLSENIEDIKKSKEVIIFEGCKSVLLAYTWGIKNAAAILTSHLNPAQMKVLASLGCRVVFALDKDVNIKKDRNIEKLKRYANVEYIFDGRGELDDKDSPVDKGKEVFCRLYDERKRYR